jgi:hypothetical protein
MLSNNFVKKIMEIRRVPAVYQPKGGSSRPFREVRSLDPGSNNNIWVFSVKPVLANSKILVGRRGVGFSDA